MFTIDDYIREVNNLTPEYVYPENVVFSLEGSLLAHGLISDVDEIKLYVTSNAFWKMESKAFKGVKPQEDPVTKKYFYVSKNGVKMVLGPGKFSVNLKIHDTFVKFKGFKILSKHQCCLEMCDTGNPKYRDLVMQLKNLLPKYHLAARYKVSDYLENVS